MVKPRRYELYVEGGGDHNPDLASECRKAFSKLFEKAGVTRKPRVIVCGGRKIAYDQFCLAMQEGASDAWLLVDAEDVVSSGPPFNPWSHVRTRQGDGWVRPNGATDDQLHFMAVCMETWLLSDREALKATFGPKLDVSKLPDVNTLLECVEKVKVYGALAKATEPTPSETYKKGAHSFKALAEVKFANLRILSWAARFLDEMTKS